MLALSHSTVNLAAGVDQTRVRCAGVPALLPGGPRLSAQGAELCVSASALSSRVLLQSPQRVMLNVTLVSRSIKKYATWPPNGGQPKNSGHYQQCLSSH